MSRPRKMPIEDVRQIVDAVDICATKALSWKARALAAEKALATQGLDQREADKAAAIDAARKDERERTVALVKGCLSACQYDPAPYTCMKYRLDAILPPATSPDGTNAPAYGGEVGAERRDDA